MASYVYDRPSTQPYWSMLDHQGSIERGWSFDDGALKNEGRFFLGNCLRSDKSANPHGAFEYVLSQARDYGCPFAKKALDMFVAAGGSLPVEEYDEPPY